MSDEQGSQVDEADIAIEVKEEDALTPEEKALLEKHVPLMAEKLQLAAAEINKVIKGQEQVVSEVIATMVAGGNLLMVGVPGLAKTLLVNTIGKVMALDSKRVQFTPDLLPSDIIGTEVLDDGEFKFTKGPVFTQLLMADEINRAPPKVQSALLQAMQEHEVTVAGTSYLLDRPFMVMATQNPLEQEGTYPLPEAQLDRFMMQVEVDYPDKEAERWLTSNTTGPTESVFDLFEKAANDEDLTKPSEKESEINVDTVLDKNDMILMRELAAAMPLSKNVVELILDLVRKARPTDPEASDHVKNNVKIGPGPRALQAFARAAKANALIHGRYAPNTQDVMAVAEPILRHRVIHNYQAEAEAEKAGVPPIQKTLEILAPKVG
jgi:MoxR-like ATPase